MIARLHALGIRRWLPLLLAMSAALPAQRHDEITFQHQATLPVGWSVYLLGDLEELGANNLARSIRMTQRVQGSWQITVRLPVNRQFQYSFYQRVTLSPSLVASASHGTLLAGPIQGSTAARALAPTGKRLVGHAALAAALLHWRQGSGPFQILTLLDRGAGRTANERLYEAPAFGTAGLPVEFYLTDGSGAQQLPAAGTYATPLDAFFLQDDHVFDYWPAPQVSPHRRDYAPANPPSIFSTLLNQSRTYRVMLPRGYDDHPHKRYPVIYFHDGPWMFDPGTFIYLFSDVIDPNGDTTARLVQRGEVGECILVAVDWGTTIPSQVEIARARNYLPPGSGYDYGSGFIPGAADVYAAFLIQELKPLIDATYRTLPGPGSTFTSGFSFGGVVAAYLGWDYGHVFARLGLFSPSLWVQSFPPRLQAEPLRAGLRIYMDSGFDNFGPTAQMRDNWVSRAVPWRLEAELRYAFDPLSTQHTPTEVNRRLPAMLRFLLPASEEPNPFLFGAVPYGAASGPNPLQLQWLPGPDTHAGAVAATASGGGAWAGIVGLAVAPGATSIAGIDVWLALDPPPLVGAIAAGAAGSFAVPLELASTVLVGQRFFLQVVRVDPAGLSASNGLELDFGR